MGNSHESAGVVAGTAPDSLDPRTGRAVLVVSDAFLTETAQLADVVLPAVLWGEKTGCYTNADRTVHLSERAVDAPGEARSDLDILLDYASRMDLRDRDGAPLVKWSTPEQAWRAFTQITRGQLCDQSALSYDRLRGSAGIQWPCTDESPDGTARLYTDHRFVTESTAAESYGHDLMTGAENEADEYRAHDPGGRPSSRPRTSASRMSRSTRTTRCS